MTKKDFKIKVDYIIKRDFKGIRKPYIWFLDRDDIFMATFNFLFFYALIVDKEVFKMNDMAITGCLVHELCHIKNWSYKDDERETDQMVIDMGYGVELYEFLKYHDRHYVKYKNKDGLTKKEVFKKIKKQMKGDNLIKLMDSVNRK